MSKLCLHLRRPGFRGEAPRRGCGLNPGGRCPAGGLPADAEQSGRESSALQAWEGLVAWAVRTGAVSPRGLPQLAWSWSSPGAAYPCCLWGRLWAAGPRPSEPSPSGSWCTPGSGGGRACSHLTSEAPPPHPREAPFCLALLACSLVGGGVRGELPGVLAHWKPCRALAEPVRVGCGRAGQGGKEGHERTSLLDRPWRPTWRRWH